MLYFHTLNNTLNYISVFLTNISLTQGDYMQNNFYPINLDISDINVLIIGLGTVGYRKLCSIIDICKNIKIVSLDISKDKLTNISARQNIHYEIRKYESCDIDGYDMIFACTDDDETQRKILSDISTAQKNRFILANFCKHQESSNFANMSSIRTDDYAIAITTYGNDPKLSKNIREKLENFSLY